MHSIIAKELNIVNYDSLKQSSILTPSMLTLGKGRERDVSYYLRGYKAIDKEIELIKNKKYLDLEFIKKEINSVKKENINWVNYNINLIEIESLKKSKLIFTISILLGLMIGIIYVLISNVFQIQASTKKRN